MAADIPVVIYPPAPDGGRRVRIGDRFVGMAYTVLDVVEFLRRAGPEVLASIEETDVVGAGWIEWRGAGPREWPR
ncbi:hypothetical protein [Streptomyces seoulensis]|uniref:Uncharacterized protein n=1 Tax=Streptomyces seoulensis TaxID=73044 RepID=A0A4P6U1Z7_STRSO|nr:hypothetical protein [Streptomyces seoulensis]QBJ93870.1 hypothetical protein D0Z67_28780 [Streptomyces seoulensis]